MERAAPRIEKWIDQIVHRERPRGLRGAASREPERNVDWTVTYTDKPTSLTGVFQDSSGRAATDYYILVFSSDRKHWTPGSRRIRMTRPATDGAFSVKGLRPASTFVAALAGPGDGRVERSDAARAARAVVGEGHTAGRRDDDAGFPDWSSSGEGPVALA